jgi:hypothetical protein
LSEEGQSMASIAKMGVARSVERVSASMVHRGAVLIRASQQCRERKTADMVKRKTADQAGYAASSRTKPVT